MLDMNAAIDLAVDFIGVHEGCMLKAYPDPATGGVPWTIGYGSTHGVSDGMVITKAEATYRLRVDLQIAISALRDRIDDVLDTLTPHQAAALFSFVFNLGTGKYRKGDAQEWTIWKVLRAKRYDQVPAELVKFVNAGGKKMAGLVKRRADETVLWSTAEPGSVDDAPPSAVTRVIDTPPTAADPVPASKSAHVWTMALGAITGVPVLVQNGAEQVSKLVSPYADQAPLLHNVLEWCGMAAAAAAVAGFAWAYLGKRWLRN